MRVTSNLFRTVSTSIMRLNPLFNTINSVRKFGAAAATQQTVKETPSSVSGANKQADKQTSGSRIKGMNYIIILILINNQCIIMSSIVNQSDNLSTAM